VAAVERDSSSWSGFARAAEAVCEQRDPGDLTTIDDPSALQQIKQSLG